MRIALDAMGGDKAPGPIVSGGVQAAVEDPELVLTLVGDRSQIEPYLREQPYPADRIRIYHCTQSVQMDESPVEALRRKPDNSISRCWQLLASREVDAIVSAGNTGAMVAGGLRLKRFLPHVRRPGIAAVMPTLRGRCVMLDVGANVKPRAEHLYQYGVMGSIFAKHILRTEHPRIGLMNIGSEAQKGHDLAKETHRLFNESPLQPYFIGNVEGRDLFTGVCDVIVTDGFVGNVALKLSEGAFDFTLRLIGGELQQRLSAERDTAQAAIMDLARRYDYHETGGAPLLGIDGICIICHGSSGDRAIRNALFMAAKYVRAGLNSLIVRELATGLNCRVAELAQE